LAAPAQVGAIAEYAEGAKRVFGRSRARPRNDEDGEAAHGNEERNKPASKANVGEPVPSHLRACGPPVTEKNPEGQASAEGREGLHRSQYDGGGYRIASNDA